MEMDVICQANRLSFVLSTNLPCKSDESHREPNRLFVSWTTDSGFLPNNNNSIQDAYSKQLQILSHYNAENRKIDLVYI